MTNLSCLILNIGGNTNSKMPFKINYVNAEWCNIQSCINCKSLLKMCKISAKCTTLDYIDI
ncbi:hypothetical protein BpHYR1_020130 [Brachionus plicatilis]|uniref:Uncharacterized protein n=1 Tax=Brachionus plicatilis TaxID=10195 RepID=A0A3M7RY61_BRAPC|nr:hypothetical protein BpHYR1_020130 [Brachionus plicatilis]